MLLKKKEKYGKRYIIVKTLNNLLQSFITNREINISAEDWSNICQIYPKEDIIHELATIVSSDLINLPLKSITLNDAINAQKGLMEYQTSLKEGKIFTRYEKNLDDYYFDESANFNDASNYFHQLSRYTADSVNSPSPVRTWNTYKFAKSMVSALFSLKCKEVNKQTLHSCLAMRKYIASQFKPSVAKAVYDYFNGKNVVDLCSGWGDRLSGFYASKNTKSYFGIDPNSSLCDGYNRQIIEYNKLVHKDTEMVCQAAEDEVVKLPTCDLVFTSPPYFGVEKYSKDENQSYLRYRKFDNWLVNFLFKIIQKSYNALEKDGHLVLNISDVYMNHTINNICSPMIEYCKELGFKHIGTWGMRMAKRTNSQSDKDGIFCEPMYIFEK